MRPYLSPKLTSPQSEKRNRNSINRFFSWLHTLSPADGFVMRTGLIVFCVFLVALLIQISMRHTVSVPIHGGVFSEGEIGIPRFVNPVLATTQADKDLSALVYNGLLRLGVQGVLENNIAESVTPSSDGLTYTVVLKKNVTFQDKTPLTAHDVAFTVARIQDPALHSPLSSNFNKIKVEVVNDYELNFILPEPYSPFPENLRFGILPEHIWKDVALSDFPFSSYNTHPIGSGPYIVDSVTQKKDGMPDTYTLKSYAGYLWGAPHIKTIELHFFQSNTDLIAAFKKGVVDSAVGVTSDTIAALTLESNTSHVEQIPQSRTMVVFFNQNKSPVLRDPAVRSALSAIVDRNQLVQTILGGYGSPLWGPIPPGFGIPSPVLTTVAPNEEDVRAILRNGGWKLNETSGIWEKEIDGTTTPLSFTLATENERGFVATAEFLKKAWEQIGISVQIDQFEQNDLRQSVIRPRDYEALLFGAYLGRSFDYYSYWHSSQRTDGLNVGLFANKVTDPLLSQIRVDTDATKRTKDIQRFADELMKENPALFLYAPKLLYVFPNNVHGASFTGVSDPEERFARVQEWFMETESVWPFFTKTTQ